MNWGNYETLQGKVELDLGPEGKYPNRQENILDLLKGLNRLKESRDGLCELGVG